MEDLKCEINCRDKFQRTPLHWAARFANICIVEWLVANGASFHVLDCEGWSALDLAKHHKHEEVIKVMLNQDDIMEKHKERQMAKKLFFEERKKVEIHSLQYKMRRVIEKKCIEYREQLEKERIEKELAELEAAEERDRQEQEELDRLAM